jgi:3-hydroxybutyrate dehydrogenase
MTDRMLTGRNALVTGSTSGIGLGIALAMARAGANLMLNGFGDSESAQQLVSKFGTKVHYHAADMSQPDQIVDLLRACECELGGVDILVNNAGIQYVAPVEDFPVEQWDAILAINLSAAFHTTRLALGAMKRRDWGRIINIASVHGLVASVHKSAYVAAKHGLVGFTKAIALETALTRVTVNAICPGWVLTPLVQQQVDARAHSNQISRDQAQRQLLAEKQPSPQFSTPEQIAELAVFMCTSAADNIRGVAWNIDGGWLAQ